MQIAVMFSNEIIYLSADFKSLIKVETAGSLKGKVIQLCSENVTVRDHDAGVDTIGKICLYVVLLMALNPSLWEFEGNHPEPGQIINKLGYINIFNDIIKGWNKTIHTKTTEGLAVAFAHNSIKYKKSASRNASDICDLIYFYLPYFTLLFLFP